MVKKKKYYLLFVLIVTIYTGTVFADDAAEYFRKGHRSYLDGKNRQSENEFKHALSLDPKLSDAHYYLGSIFFKQQRYPDAIFHCETALEINPSDLKSLIILGLSFQKLDRNKQAISTFEQACRIDSQSAAAHSALGLAYCAQGDFAQAKEQYAMLKEIDAKLAEDLRQRINQGQTLQ